MARRRLEGLERVLGVNALFSTAYGNVGSSIYYALGLVASYALGLTPVVFIITGFFFFCTAATLRRGDGDVPRGRRLVDRSRGARSTSSGRSSPPGAGMLNYIITIAISAFFVPHYIGGLFWRRSCKTGAGRHHRRRDRDRRARRDQRLRRQGVGRAQRVRSRSSTSSPSCCWSRSAPCSCSRPRRSCDNVELGVAPTWEDFILAIPIGMLAYTGIETISNMAEEAKDEATTIPRAINRVRIAVFAIYFTLPAVALSALPVTRGRRRVPDAARPDRGGGRLRRRPDARRRQADRPRAASRRAGELYVGLLAATILFLATNAGDHRRLAARLLDGHPPPDARRAAAAAPALPHALDRHPRLQRRRDRR